MSTPTTLSIAGSDPSGGAGIQADLKTFTAHGCYGASVITALTAQSTRGVFGVHPCPPDFVKQQLEVLLDDIQFDAIKTGMLYDAKTIQIIVEVLESHFRTHGRRKLVVDPVMVSTSGHTLLEGAAIETLRSKLFPLASLITPNIPEAELLVSLHKEPQQITSIGQMRIVAQRLSVECNVPSVLLKGGHLKISMDDLKDTDTSDAVVVYPDVCDPNYPEILRPTEEQIHELTKHGYITDVLYESTNENSSMLFTIIIRPRIDTRNTHGTGCTLSAAIACELAKGHSVSEAVKRATAYTHLGIATATSIGNGNGPLNHLHPLMNRVIHLPSSDCPSPFITAMIEDSRAKWKEFVEHPFVHQLGRGTLPIKCFVHFIKQDYLYLQYYARAYGLLVAKSSTFATMEISTKILQQITNEFGLMKSLFDEWGISQAELDREQETSATTAYGAFIIDAGFRGDETSLLVAVAACLLGYGEVGLWLVKESTRNGSGIYIEGNKYSRWIVDYAGEKYQSACREGIQALEARMAADPPSQARLDHFYHIWSRCLDLERDFWNMALDVPGI